MNMRTPESALDRYLRQTSWRLSHFGIRGERNAIMRSPRPILIAGGVALLVFSFFASIFLTASLLLVLIGGYYLTSTKKPSEKSLHAQSHLSSDAQELMNRLLETVQFSEKLTFTDRVESFVWAGVKTRADQVLSVTTFALLDRAATEANRTLVTISQPQIHTTLKRMKFELQAAVDEGMASCLEQIVLLEKCPEVTSPVVLIEKRIQELRELAVHVEKLTARDNLEMSAEAAPTLQRALEDLRFDELSRIEIDQEDLRN